MSRLLLALLLSVAAPASALECKPRDIGGTGGALIVRSNAAGASYGWTCGPGRFHHFWLLWSQAPANWAGLLTEAIAGGTLDSFATKHFVMSPKDAEGRALHPAELTDVVTPVFDALKVAATPPAESWKVLAYPFRADGARPIFHVAAGVRSKVSVANEYAPKDSDCDPATKVTEGSVTYMAVRGRLDWVAVCTLR